jgi:hypothetical protein
MIHVGGFAECEPTDCEGIRHSVCADGTEFEERQQLYIEWGETV